MAASADKASEPRWALGIHGGAGVINSSNTLWLDDAKRGLETSLRAGAAVLESGGSAIDAVVAAVQAMEDDPHFNAGTVAAGWVARSCCLVSRTNPLVHAMHISGTVPPLLLCGFNNPPAPSSCHCAPHALHPHLMPAAGVGSVLTASGRHELEASVMTDDGRCGAVALVKRIAHPARLAQQVRGVWL